MPVRCCWPPSFRPALPLAPALLQVFPNSTCLVVSTENITQVGCGRQPSVLHSELRHVPRCCCCPACGSCQFEPQLGRQGGIRSSTCLPCPQPVPPHPHPHLPPATLPPTELVLWQRPLHAHPQLPLPPGRCRHAAVQQVSAPPIWAGSTTNHETIVLQAAHAPLWPSGLPVG